MRSIVIAFGMEEKIPRRPIFVKRAPLKNSRKTGKTQNSIKLVQK
jgi:hypothetical protein